MHEYHHQGMGDVTSVGEDAAQMREILHGSDWFSKEDSGVAVDESHRVAEFTITAASGARYNVTVRDAT